MPAAKPGASGSCAAVVGQEPCPAAGVVVWKESVGVASAPSGEVQGVSVAVVVWVPQVGGVRSGARAPSKKCSLKSSKGSCGLWLTTVVSLPVCGSSLTSPASFTTTPVCGSETVI